ncbi:MAG TPA: 50S ribosomal protein L30 [Syntrophomonadaceae bacterium]|nr:50S ribosomal protein L30 [Syntrophomonadaceae bacterium]
MAKQLRITWTKSSIGYPRTQRLTIQSLGLRKLNHSVIKDDCAQIRGQIEKVKHMVRVEELNEA